MIQRKLFDELKKLSGTDNLSITESIDFTSIKDLEVKEKKRLQSKRNLVFKFTTDDKKFAVKKFDEKHAVHEYHTLKQVYDKGVKVPRPLILIGENVLITEFIEGSNLCDQLNKTLDVAYSDSLAEWFFRLHASFRRNHDSMVKSESILRNFIDSRDGIFGVDFEFSHYGDPLKDVGEICASILDTHPMFTDEKLKICRELIHSYNYRTNSQSSHEVALWIARALENTSLQRPEQRKILTEKANDIRTGKINLVK
jgi:tRNA A-37 threonylcarbamoyl transferase component Bud32